MRSRYPGTLGAVAAGIFAAGTATTVPIPISSAQATRTHAVEPAQLLPPPLGAPLPGQRNCSSAYQRLLKLQAEGMRQLLRLSRGDGEKLCSALENADTTGIDKLIDPKALEPLLTPDQRDVLGALGIDLGKVNVPKLMQRLGIDLSRIDLRQITQQCRQHQGDLERFATGELERLENEMLRCDDRV
jgi:hypothetical protein